MQNQSKREITFDIQLKTALSKANTRIIELSPSNLVFQNNVKYSSGHNHLSTAWLRDLGQQRSLCEEAREQISLREPC